MTARQRDVLQALHSHLSSCGYPPTVRDLCSMLGLASPATVQKHLDALIREQLVERAGGRWLRPTTLGLSALNGRGLAA